jgi:glycine/D-amino acid oxidase-like deaminating enzyme
VALRDGRYVEADVFVFACGPWLGALFPDVIGPLIASTRQEVYYLGTPAGDPRFLDDRLPAWIEVGDDRSAGRVWYGIPGHAHRGFKIADDTTGPAFDPTSGDRTMTDASAVAGARTFIRQRFPDLADAPLLGAEVCQYESTPDSHFIIDRHPTNSNFWIVGGGSGHGFKMGPAVGEIVTGLVLGTHEPDPAFRLARFSEPPASGWDRKWS